MTDLLNSRWLRTLGVVFVIGIAGCASSGGAAAPSTLAFSNEPQSLEEVGCEALLSEAEVNEIMSGEFISLGRQASSCYWSTAGDLVQLVVQTGDTVESWRGELLRTFTERVDGYGFEIWKEKDSNSIAAFGPQRGLIIHGVTNEARAIQLLRLALVRL